MPAQPQQLRSFMEALGQAESGGWEDQYAAIGEDRGSRYGIARGKYQIMSEIWPHWAREAGYADANWRDPKAQEAVAAFKMNQYYERYGSWALVAVAWFAGEQAAKTARDQGIDSLAALHDGGNKGPERGLNVPGYVAKVIRNLEGGVGATFDPSQFPEEDRIGIRQVQQNLQGATQPQPTPKSPNRQLAQSVIGSLSDQMRQNPGNAEVRMRITQAMQRLYGGGDSRMLEQTMQQASGSPATPGSGGGSVRATSANVTEAPGQGPPPEPPGQAGTASTSGVI